MAWAREVIRPHILDQQLDIGISIVDILLNGVTDMKGQHLLDMRIIGMHAEGDGMNRRARLSPNQFQLQMLQLLTDQLAGAIILHVERSEYRFLIIRPKRAHLL